MWPQGSEPIDCICPATMWKSSTLARKVNDVQEAPRPEPPGRRDWQCRPHRAHRDAAGWRHGPDGGKDKVAQTPDRKGGAARRDVTPERRAEIARQGQRSAVLGVDTPDQARAWASPEARQGYAISPIRLRGYLGFSRALTSVWNGLLLFRLGASATLLARFLMSAGFRIGGLRAR